MNLESLKAERHPPASMTIDLNAVKHNLAQCRQRLQATTRIMLVLKAHAYGTNVRNTTHWAQQTGEIDYIAVAFVDEGVEMRQLGITLPIMVMNIEDTAFQVCQTFDLEPVIYSLSILDKLVQWLNKMTAERKLFTFPGIHIKLNTGMNRLGVDIADLPQLLNGLSNSQPRLTTKSVYSHLAASDDPKEDHFTAQQARLFLSGAQFLEKNLGYSILKHLCNTFGIARHPHLHFDMVRLGAGIFGGRCFPESYNLLPAISLTSTISQVRRIKAGETMGYNRRGLALHDTRIGVLRIGYADGLRRHMGSGKAYAWVRNCRVPIIKGSVCMDMTTVDLTDVPIDNDTELEGNVVEIFGKHIDINEVAQWCDTIAYELITSINQRVERVYTGDSIQSFEQSTADSPPQYALDTTFR